MGMSQAKRTRRPEAGALEKDAMDTKAWKPSGLEGWNYLGVCVHLWRSPCAYRGKSAQCSLVLDGWGINTLSIQISPSPC